MRCFVLLMLLAGCDAPSGDPTAIAGQGEAVALIWNAAYGQTKAAPEIYWRRDHCDESNGIYGVLRNCTFENDGERVAGLETIYDSWVEVGAPSPGFKISDTALAHELLHAAIGDAGHTSDAWLHVSDVDQALRAKGL